MGNIRGFSLIELLVVIGIIGVLATLAVVSFIYTREYAKITKAQGDLTEIHTATSMLADDCGTWPGHQEIEEITSSNTNEICGDGCSFGISDPEAGIEDIDGTYDGWTGPYIENIPLDPWGNEYFFDTDYSINANNEPCNGGSGCSYAVVVGSYGPDRVGRNQYNGDDVIKIIAK